MQSTQSEITASYFASVEALGQSAVAASGVDELRTAPLGEVLILVQLGLPQVQPLPWNRCTRPVPLGLVNSLESMPILSSTHSMGSTEPVCTAKSGMLLSGSLPSPCLRGRRVWTAVSAVLAQ